MKSKIALLITFLFFITLIGCKPTAKNEMNKYNSNVKTLNSISAEWPAFKSELLTVSKDAAKIIEEGNKIKDEEKKALKFEEANKAFSNSDLYAKLSSYSQREISAVKLMEELNGYKTIRKYKAFKFSIQNAVNKAVKKIDEAKALMDNTKASDSKAAFEALKEANSMLIDVESDLNNLKRRIKKSTKKRKK
jgi:hypothetical protein